MRKESFYTKGIIKNKNADGVLVPFYPETKTESIYDYEENRSFISILEELENRTNDAANSGGIKAIDSTLNTDDEMFDAMTQKFSNETMMLFYSDTNSTIFKFTVNTSNLSSSNTKSGIPFSIPTDFWYLVDWGDGTVDYIDKSDSSKMMHTYASTGTYTIQVYCPRWKKTQLLIWSNLHSIEQSYINRSNTSYVYYYTKTLSKILTPIPKVANGSFQQMFYATKVSSIPENLFWNNTHITSFYSCFENCTSLSSIPSRLFKGFTKATDFRSVFEGCTSITSIPSGLFDDAKNATNFAHAFNSCTSLTTIPSGLFDNSPKVTSFSGTFFNCRLSSIPAGLFKNNTEVTSFQGTFGYCRFSSIPEGLFDNCTKVQYFGSTIGYSWYYIGSTNYYFNGCFGNCTNLSSIPEHLFDKCTNIVHINSCFSDCSYIYGFTIHITSPNIGTGEYNRVNNFIPKKSGYTRIVYVPAGSATQAAFEEYASSLGITVIGE